MLAVLSVLSLLCLTMRLAHYTPVAASPGSGRHVVPPIPAQRSTGGLCSGSGLSLSGRRAPRVVGAVVPFWKIGYHASHGVDTPPI
jgi:hypothetical protein